MTMLALMLLLAAAPTSPPAATVAKESPAAQAPAPARPTPAAPPAEAKKAEANKDAAKKAEAKKDAAKKDAAPVTPPAPVKRKPFRWNIPGMLTWVDSAGVQVSDGVPLILQMALSKEPIDRLIQHFADEFQEAGFFIPPGHEQAKVAREPQLTAYDPLEKVAYTVIFQENKDKTTTLILGTSDLSNYQPGAATKTPGWAPMPGGAKDLMTMEMEGGQNVVFIVSAAVYSQEQVMAFYREKLGKAGFVETEKDPGEFHKEGETIRVSTRLQDGQVVVSLIRRLGSEGPGFR